MLKEYIVGINLNKYNNSNCSDIINKKLENLHAIWITM